MEGARGQHDGQGNHTITFDMGGEVMRNDRRVFLWFVLLALACGGCGDEVAEKTLPVATDEVLEADGRAWELMSQEEKDAVGRLCHKLYGGRPADDWSFDIDTFYANYPSSKTIREAVVHWQEIEKRGAKLKAEEEAEEEAERKKTLDGLFK